MLDRLQILTLDHVLSTGSFEGAAAILNITPSAVSQRIKALEEHVGAVLVLRGQPCVGTPAGNRLARHAKDVGLLEATLAKDLNLSKIPPAKIRIAMNADSLSTWVVPALACVDRVLYDIILDDQDHSAEWLRRGEVSAAITAHGRPIQGCDSMPLGHLRYYATASPGFVARWFPQGVTPKALSKAPALTFNQKDQLQRDWILATTGATLSPPTHFLPSSTAFVEASLQGIGWGLNPEPLVRDHLKQGCLLALSDQPFDIALFWQSSRLTAQALSTLQHAIRRAAKTALV